MLMRQITAFNLPQAEREYKFHPLRKWRIDYCWPGQMLAVEIEGGIWQYGRHNRAASFLKDMEKYNALALMGYRLLRFTPQEVTSGKAALTIKDYMLAHKQGFFYLKVEVK